MSDKKKKSSKSGKTEKHEKHHSSGKKIAEAMKTIMAAVAKKPKHYTTRYLASEAKYGAKFGSEIVRAAIAGLEEKEAITFSRKDGGKGKKGAFVLVPLTKKAA